jgi:hypothetical protein
MLLISKSARVLANHNVKMAKDAKFRAAVAERTGLGFDLPKTEMIEVVPSVPSSQEMEVSVSI